MTSLLRRLRWLLVRRRKEAELRAEIAFHLEEEADDARARGLSAEGARLAARRHLGNPRVVEEETRGAWGWTRLERVTQDVRYAARVIRRRPVLSATTILTLTLTIGGTTAVFSLADALFLKPLPVERPGDLVRLTERRPDTASILEVFTVATHDRLRREGTVFSALVASSQAIREAEVVLDDDVRRAVVQLVSKNYFDVLRPGPLEGRVFHQAPAEPIAVLSKHYWQRQYGGDKSALGSRLRYGGHEFRIAGVAARGFRGLDIDTPADIWLPLDQVVPPGADDRVRGRWMHIAGRLPEGVTLAQADAEAAAILGRPVQLQPGATGYSRLRPRLARPLLLVGVGVTLVLLVACANLASLMMSATLARERELQVRAAIGASSARIASQLVTESVLITAAGAVFGLAVAAWTNSALLAFLPPEQAVAAQHLRFRFDGRVAGFVALLSFTTCLLFGCLPALRIPAALGALRAAASATPPHRARLSRTLLAGQVALCTALLVLAGVFTRTVQNLRGQDGGYLEDRVLVADVGFPGYYAESQRDQLIEDLRTRAAALPGVEIAAFSQAGQLSGRGIEFRIGFPGREEAGDSPLVMEQRVSPGFLSAMGTPLLAGRDFGPGDHANAPPVAIVNEAFARRFLAGDDPIGARFFRRTASGPGEALEVVGVVRDSKWINLRDDRPPMYYRPYGQMGGTPVVRLALRTTGDPAAVAGELRRLAATLDPQMTLSNLVRFREIVDRTLVVERLVAQVSTAFGLLALAIAAIGLYGVLAYGVARRTREIGIRIAVGARPAAIERMFLLESVAVVSAGVAIGLPGGIALAGLGASLLFGLGPHDPVSLAAAIGALMLTSVAAALLPARRAARIDPVLVLRSE